MSIFEEQQALISELRNKLEVYRSVGVYTINGTKAAIEDIDRSISNEDMDSNRKILRIRVDELVEALDFIERDLRA